MTLATIQDVLRLRARRTPTATAISVLAFDVRGVHSTPVSYARLDRRAQAIAARLSALSRPGDRAIVALDEPAAFVEAFFGCLYAGLVPVPVARPRPRVQDRLAVIAQDCGARIVLRESERDDALAATVAHTVLPATVPDGLALDAPHATPTPADAIAFLQYTSGSTGCPRGVIVTQRGLLANMAQIRKAFGHDASCVGVNWLPLHHDMGLIGTVLQPIFVGFPSHLMSPLTFVQHPRRWLEAIAALGGTTCGGPPFAFRHCVDKIAPAARAGLDLGTWRVAFCGAEPIGAQPLRDFADAFAPVGFRSSCLLPCYGLAEATLLVTAAARDTGVASRRFDVEALESGRAEPATGDTARELVSCGTAAEGAEVIVQGMDGLRLSAGLVGELCVASPALGRGYWGDPEATRARFGDGLLRTGDLGFKVDGELFVTGRLKDLIILDGRNITPQDIEETATRAHPCAHVAAAFALPGATGEGIGLAVEVSGQPVQDGWRAMGDVIRRAVTLAHGVPLAHLALVQSATLPRTTSGKLVRVHCRRAALAHELAVLAEWTPAAGWRMSQRDGAAAPAAGWLLHPRAPRADGAAPRLRLFCFPYAGGGAATYARWAARLPAAIQVCPVQLPGRENRWREAPLRAVEPLLKSLEAVVDGAAQGEPPLPFAFFGHSMGAHVAFALARHLRRRGRAEPAHLLLSGARSPECAPIWGGSAGVGDEEFCRRVASFGQLPRQSADDPLGWARALPLLRADFELGEALEAEAASSGEAPVEASITVFGGRADPFVTAGQLAGWQAHSLRPVRCCVVEGDHFFVESARAEVLEALVQALDPVAEQAPPRHDKACA
jgi:acyl-CoA synthetase (AMP-forming)/AMP-acid ligase II/surfactin synthase thioesterase subunit